MRKKAILPEETLKLVLAVGCILVLLLLAYNIYGIFRAKNQLEIARGNLKNIVYKIKGLEKEGDSMNALITGPKKWYFVVYNKKLIQNKEGLGIPKQCKGEVCICICPGKIIPKFGYDYEQYFYKEGLKDCEERGVCEEVDANLISENVNFYFILLGLAEGYHFYKFNFFYLEPIPKSISLIKTKEGISVFSGENELISGLLAEMVSLSGLTQKISFEEMLLMALNYCRYTDNKGKVPEINDEYEKIAENAVKEYFKKKEISNGYVDVYVVDKSKVNSYMFGSGFSGNRIRQIKKLCEKEVVVYAEINKKAEKK